MLIVLLREQDVECLLMVWWVTGSILHGGPIEIFLVPASVHHEFNIELLLKIIILYLSSCSWCNGSLDQSFMVDPLRYFLFQPVCIMNLILNYCWKLLSCIFHLVHGVMGHRINPSWWTHWDISCSSQWHHEFNIELLLKIIILYLSSCSWTKILYKNNVY